MKAGDKVQHTERGGGTVVSVNGNGEIKVAFEESEMFYPHFATFLASEAGALLRAREEP